MTEREALKIISNIPVAQVNPNTGMVQNVDDIVLAFSVIEHSLKVLEDYRSFGTVDEVRCLKQYHTPTKPLPKGTHKLFDNYCCPSCKRPFDNMFEEYEWPYCQGCGQAILWNSENNELEGNGDTND